MASSTLVWIVEFEDCTIVKINREEKARFTKWVEAAVFVRGYIAALKSLSIPCELGTFPLPDAR